ncbi:MAG: hypothetical protein HGA31_03900 [Candidatus Moranbacteria bacterium]|nr:hypothetical protein [Candidatus Moranbacteria bacterium]
MKIELVPEGNKTKRDGDSDWNLSYLFDTVFGGVGSLVEKVFEIVVNGVEAAVSGTIRRLFALAMGLIGLWFLFGGFASLLDFLYGVPGIGGITVGSVVFIAAIIVSATAGRK